MIGADKRLNTPNLSITPELSYILGVVFGDGCLYRNGRHSRVILRAVDRGFVDEFNFCISKVLKKDKLFSVIPVLEPKGNQPSFLVSATSKLLYEFLHGKTAVEFNDLIEEYPSNFIRGLADSDGNVHLVRDQQGRLAKTYLKITNTNKSLLELSQTLLWRHFAISSNLEGPYLTINGTEYFNLSITKREDLLKFHQYINFVHSGRRSKLIAIVRDTETRQSDFNRTDLRDSKGRFIKGHIPTLGTSGKVGWNKGLTARIDERVRKVSEAVKRDWERMTGEEKKYKLRGILK